MRNIVVIIDGPNVAHARATALARQNRDDAAAVWECYSYFTQRNAKSVKIFGPRGWCESTPGLVQMRNSGEILFATPGGLDDKFMLQTADEQGAFLVSNDRYLDHSEFSQEWVAFHRVPFMHAPNFVAERDALDRIASYERGQSHPMFDAGRARLPQLQQRYQEQVMLFQQHQQRLHVQNMPETPQPTLRDDMAAASSSSNPSNGYHSIGHLPPMIAPFDDPSNLTAAAPEISSRKLPSDDFCEIVVSIPYTAIGRIIGRQGVTINTIRRESGATVEVREERPLSTSSLAHVTSPPLMHVEGHGKPNDAAVEQGDASAWVTITGTQGAVTMARTAIESILNQHLPKGSSSGSVRTASSGRLVESFRVPRCAVGRIIGRGGCNINRIRRETDVCIEVRDEDAPVGHDQSTELWSTVEIMGDSHAIQAAWVAIMTSAKLAPPPRSSTGGRGWREDHGGYPCDDEALPGPEDNAGNGPILWGGTMNTTGGGALLNQGTALQLQALGYSDQAQSHHHHHHHQHQPGNYADLMDD